MNMVYTSGAIPGGLKRFLHKHVYVLTRDGRAYSGTVSQYISGKNRRIGFPAIVLDCKNGVYWLDAPAIRNIMLESSGRIDNSRKI